MQSKTSFFNPAVFRKNLTRFAPIWGAYTLCMVMALIIARSTINEYDVEFRIVNGFSQLIFPLALVNAGYALVVVQALFGDLYNSRSCYALHAMPLRREAFYVTNVLSGFLFAVVPQILVCLLMIPMTVGSCVIGGWQIPLYLLGGSILQYLFFYGLAVFSAFCAGNRVGMVGIYGIWNFAALVLGLLVESVYTQMLFGVSLSSERYDFLSPLASMMGREIVTFDDYYSIKWAWEQGDKSSPIQIRFEAVPETWAYYGICALIGVVLLILAVQLYRKRNLECAGDLLAFRWMRPVFLAVFTVLAAAAAQLAFAAFSMTDNYGYFIFLAVGLVVGWFVGIMLLNRTTRVFRKKNCVGLAVIALAYAISLGLTWLDPLNIEGWIPEKEDIASVDLGYWGGRPITVEDNSAEVDQILKLHRMALEQRLDYNREVSVLREGVREEEATPEDYRYTTHVGLYYTLKNGKTVIRRYNVWADSEAGQIAKMFQSAPEVILRAAYRDNGFTLDQVRALTVDNKPFNQYLGELDSLWAALEADCNEGNMAQDRFFHTGFFQQSEESRQYGDEDGIRYVLNLSLYGQLEGCYLDIYPDSAHTIRWLSERGILEELGITVFPDGTPPVSPVPTAG